MYQIPVFERRNGIVEFSKYICPADAGYAPDARAPVRQTPTLRSSESSTFTSSITVLPSHMLAGLRPRKRRR